jgi:hypothetical protein
MSTDQTYLEIILRRLRVCKTYKPRFGQGQSAGLSLHAFQSLYGADVFYAWFGLDHPLMYAAHKAAGGITSVYRQIGIGCEELFRQLLQDHYHLNPDQVAWSYDVSRLDGTLRKLSLDGRLAFADIQEPERHQRLMSWVSLACTQLQVEPSIAAAL